PSRPRIGGRRFRRWRQMADHRRPDRLPIKLILPNQGKEKMVPGGGNKKLFRPVDSEYRDSLGRQVKAIREGVGPAMRRTGSAPLRVRLLMTAAAKSHRPEHLFSVDTCPIIGAGRIGELFVKGTPEGLARLAGQIASNTSDRITKELSCVDAIEPVTSVLRRENIPAIEILKKSPKRGSEFLTRVRLFELGGDPDEARLVSDFEATCQQRGLPVSRGAYTSLTFEVRCRTTEDINAISGIVGVR